MTIFLKRILVALAFGVFATLMTYFLALYLFVPMEPYETMVVDGDIIQIVGDSPIIISLFATDATEPTTLTQGNTVILTTSPGVMKGYYEARATIMPGEYHLKGSTATLLLSKNATGINPGVEKREANIKSILIKMMLIFGALLGFIISPAYIPRK